MHLVKFYRFAVLLEALLCLYEVTKYQHLSLLVKVMSKNYNKKLMTE